MKIQLCVTTMNQNVEKVLQYFWQFANDDCNVHISHQITQKNLSAYKKPLPSWVFYYHMKEKWLSKNRNNILQRLKSWIWVVCDEDIKLPKDFIENVSKAYEKDPGTVAITMQSNTPKWGKRKIYKEEPFSHGLFSILHVSSIEISYNIKKIHELWVSFDENFGLWAQVPMGEEIIFLSDIIKKWGKVKYIPQVISIHPKESSGWKYGKKPKRKKLFLQRIYGKHLGYLFFVCSKLKNILKIIFFMKTGKNVI